MLLPARKLVNYESHIWDAGKKTTNKDYSISYWDTLTITYFKKINGFFGKREKTWTEKYKFQRVETLAKEEGMITVSEADDAHELRLQLKQHNGSLENGHFVTNEQYKILKDGMPEVFV